MAVALRKESVDRNPAPKYHRILPRRSLSARRAWIEIDTLIDDVSTGGVALRKESVDRNQCRNCFGLGVCRRSPQGERG